MRDGRLALGPWYVQPDSLLPTGESHVRNLLEGRHVAESIGACSTVAYVPDSFGHPAQFPQLFAGFGLGPMVYWRGNGNELDRLGPVYQWVAPDGHAVLAYQLRQGVPRPRCCTTTSTTRSTGSSACSNAWARGWACTVAVR